MITAYYTRKRSGLNDGASLVLMMMPKERANADINRSPEDWRRDIGCRAHLMGNRRFLCHLKRSSARISCCPISMCLNAMRLSRQKSACIKDMQEPPVHRRYERWNPNCGAIAIGHPHGASGTPSHGLHEATTPNHGNMASLLLLRRRPRHATIVENLKRKILLPEVDFMVHGKKTVCTASSSV
jgi:hypothetical protein